MTQRLVLPHGVLADGDDPVRLEPADAGWTYAGLRVLRLAPGVPRQVHTGEFEVFVFPLAGGCELDVDGQRMTLEGRDSVFTRVSDLAYVGRDSRITLSSNAGAEIALPMALAETRLPPRYGPAESVPVEVRGAGPATRQVTSFGTPEAWPHADRLMACELITPGGNWSSYPPHKHDHTCEVANEEIYYFRVAGRDGLAPDRSGFGLHRTYDDSTNGEEVDVTAEVRDGDVALVPRGYHGPCAASPGYDLYYLNVLAGPRRGADRSMDFCDDPAHAWVRDSWTGQATDPRCPVTSAAGRCGP
ncbi:MAG: 5-deoxy-glucuronate isomerase [Actinomycetota bacterium]|nr:5-deoxy-glucuronate isomerase [Actinomycetota bacterium]